MLNRPVSLKHAPGKAVESGREEAHKHLRCPAKCDDFVSETAPGWNGGVKGYTRCFAPVWHASLPKTDALELVSLPGKQLTAVTKRRNCFQGEIRTLGNLHLQPWVCTSYNYMLIGILTHLTLVPFSQTPIRLFDE